MTQHTISPVTLATCVEHSLHISLDGFDLSRARLYGISIVDEQAAARNEDGALRITFLAEHGDVYELLEAQTSAIVRMFDAAVVLTCGWAAPIRGPTKVCRVNVSGQTLLITMKLIWSNKVHFSR
jgi:hypothetical protein